MRRALVVAGVLVIVASGCTKEQPGESTDARAPERRVGVIGRTESLFGVDVVVTDLTSFTQSPGSVPRLVLSIRSENRSGRDQQNPDVQLRCKESPEGGSWFSGSTWEPNGLLADGIVNEGQVIVGFPSKPENPRYVVPTCTTARVQVLATDSDTGRRIALEYAVGADVVDAAVRAPVGPGLPLPDRQI